MLAVAALMAWEEEDIRVVKIGGSWTVGDYDLTLQDVRRTNYHATVVDVKLEQNGQAIAQWPEKRFILLQRCRQRKRESTIDP